MSGFTRGNTTITVEGVGFLGVGNPLMKFSLTLPDLEPPPQADCATVAHYLTFFGVRLVEA